MSTFVAIDFETASSRRDSACAVGVAAGCAGRVVLSRTYLIRPPTGQFTFTDLHGLCWEDVRDAPTFAELWPTLRTWLADETFVAAHNASFDRSVLHACCARYRLRPPRTRFVCTVELARSQWGIRPTKLPDVCRWLGIPLRHHDAGADAGACARIVLAAQADGWRLGKRRARRTKSRAIVRVARPATASWWASRLRRMPLPRLLQTWWQRLRRGITTRR
jgi:DNA polymerase-3 subunit epsilon